MDPAGKVIAAFAIGAVLGVLFAPVAGAGDREKLNKKAQKPGCRYGRAALGWKEKAG